MKIGCHCGSTIYDGTDDIPNKARLTPDQGWFAMWDALEEHVIGAVAAGRLAPDAASMKAREIFWEAGSRLMWQCEACGRLYLDGRDGTLQCFVPSTPETEKALLRKTAID
jgi:hypothetical protein